MKQAFFLREYKWTSYFLHITICKCLCKKMGKEEEMAIKVFFFIYEDNQLGKDS